MTELLSPSLVGEEVEGRKEGGKKDGPCKRYSISAGLPSFAFLCSSLSPLYQCSLAAWPGLPLLP